MEQSAPVTSRLDYRADIDGLRALAVLSVIAFHLGEKWVPGGFAGVDIFFVISGFLITGILKRELSAGQFSFGAFYARRIRRIYPALLVMIATTLVVALFVMVPKELADLAASGVAASFGFANFHFLGIADYFADPATTMPLLHTWSLGVEEQFYLAWPLLLFMGLPLCRRMRISPLIPIAMLAAGSFALYFAWAGSHPKMAFYLPWPRAWELGLGALVAFMPTLRGRALSQTSALLGIGCVIFALLETQFGEVQRLVAACVGAALLVWPRNEWEIVGGTLALPPLRFIGQVSYSLYLWHWPILVLLKTSIFLTGSLTIPDTVGYLAAVLTISWLSWTFIEQPPRSPTARPLRALIVGLGSSGVVAACAAMLVAGAGLPQRFAPVAQHYLAYQTLERQRPADEVCFIQVFNKWSQFTEAKCASFDAARPDVLLVGDSHANQFFAALVKNFPEVHFSQLTTGGCTPLLGAKGPDRCARMGRLIYEKYVPKRKFDAVILSSRWGKKNVEPTVQIIAKLHKFVGDVIVLGASPEYDANLPKLLALSAWHAEGFIRAHQHNGNPKSAEKAMRDKIRAAGATYYSVLDIVCPKGECAPVTPDDAPMLWDDDHLSLPGARYVIAQLRAKGLLAHWVAPNNGKAKS